MMSMSSPSLAPALTRPWRRGGRLRSWQSATALAAIAGGGAALAGCLLPWAEIFAGLIGVSGIRGLNGRFLAAAAILIIAAGIWHLIRGGSAARWAVGLLGAGTLACSVYLLMRLHATIAALGSGDNSMFAARGGPGLYVVAAGGLVAFATLFLPSPAARRQDDVAGQPDSAGTDPVGEGEARP